MTINLNTTACWLKLNEFEFAKRQYDLVMKLGLFNVRGWFKRAQTLLKMGLKEGARQDLLVVIGFGPNNDELRKELSKTEELCNTSREKEPLKKIEVWRSNSSRNSSIRVGYMGFEPLNLTTSNAKLIARSPRVS